MGLVEEQMRTVHTIYGTAMVEDLGNGFHRYHFCDGSSIDVCVSDSRNGPMDFGPTGREPTAKHR